MNNTINYSSIKYYNVLTDKFSNISSNNNNNVKIAFRN